MDRLFQARGIVAKQASPEPTPQKFAYMYKVRWSGDGDQLFETWEDEEKMKRLCPKSIEEYNRKRIFAGTSAGLFRLPANIKAVPSSIRYPIINSPKQSKQQSKIDSFVTRKPILEQDKAKQSILGIFKNGLRQQNQKLKLSRQLKQSQSSRISSQVDQKLQQHQKVKSRSELVSQQCYVQIEPDPTVMDIEKPVQKQCSQSGKPLITTEPVKQMQRGRSPSVSSQPKPVSEQIVSSDNIIRSEGK